MQIWKSKTWHYRPDLDIAKLDSESHWLSQVRRHDSICRELIVEWMNTGEAMQCGEEVAYFVYVRFLEASNFLARFSYFRDDSWHSPFPPPEQEDNDLLWTMLTEWWESVGQMIAFQHMILYQTEI